MIIEREPHACIETGTHATLFFNFKMASGKDHERVRPTTTTSRSMAATQLIPSRAVLDCSIYL